MLENSIQLQLHSQASLFLFSVRVHNVRISNHQSEKDTFSCSLCGGSRILPPLRKAAVAKLPCCMTEVHWNCHNAAVLAQENCPKCDFPLTIGGFIALERAKVSLLQFLLRKKELDYLDSYLGFFLMDKRA